MYITASFVSVADLMAWKARIRGIALLALVFVVASGHARISWAGQVYVSVQGGQLDKLDTVTGAVSTIANPKFSGYIAVDASGNVYGELNNSGVIEKVTSSGVISTFANVGSAYIGGLAFDALGNLFADVNAAQGHIAKITPGGIVTTFVNTKDPSGEGLAFDGAGNLYLSDYSGSGIEKFTKTGAESFIPTHSGPLGLASDPSGNLYAGIGGLVKITPGGVETTLIPPSRESDYSVAVDGSNNVFVAGYNYASTIREYSATGQVSTVGPTFNGPAFLAFAPPAAPRAVPEPSSLLTAGTAVMMGLGYLLRKRRRASAA